MKTTTNHIEIRVAFLYALFGWLWILLSDRLLAAFVTDASALSVVQTYKGFAFIAASALLIFWLLRRELALRRIVEGEFSESEERYRLLFEHSRDAVLFSTPDGSILVANPAASRILGWSEQEILQSGREGIMDVGDPRLDEALKKRANTGNFHGELTFIRKDGSRFPGEVSSTIFRDRYGNERTSTIIRDITERKKVEEILRRDEQRFRAGFDNMLEGAQILGHDWRYLYLNPAAEVHNRRPNQELVGNRYMDMWPGIEETHVFSVIKDCLEKRVPSHLENRFVYPDGLVGWFNLSIQPVPEGVLILSFDITERVRAEMQATQMKRLYATLSQVNQTIMRVKEPHELYQSICDVAVKFGGFSLAWVGLLDEVTGDVKPVAASGLDLAQWPFESINIHGGGLMNSLSATSIRTSTVVTSDDVQMDDKTESAHDIIKTLGYHASAAIPFRLKGKVTGVLALSSPESDLFKAMEELRLLDEMGLDISFALDNMETERIRRQWADAFEHCGHGIVIGDPATNRIRSCNPAFARDQGGTVDEFTNMPLLDMYASEERGQIRQLIEQSDKAGSVQFEARKVRKDGGTYDVHMSLVSVRDEAGNLLYRVATQQDITARKQAEKKLEQQNLRLKTLREIDTAILASDSVENIVGAALDHIRELIDCERANLALIDWQKNEAVNFDVRDAKESAISKGARVSLDLIQDILRILSQNQPVLMKDLTLLPDPPPQIKIFIQEGLRSRCILPLLSQGKLIGSFTLSSAIPDYFDEEKVDLGREVANQVAIAITQKRLVESLQEGEARLAGIIGSAMDGIISVDANQNIILANSAAEKMFGYTSEEMIGRPLEMLIPASLREAHRGHIERFGGSGETTRSMHSLGEVKGLRANGEEFPIEASISQIEVAGGKIFTVIHRDITERRRTEEKLRESEAVYRRAMEVAGAVPYYETYYDNASKIKYEFIGEGIRSITGYGPEEFTARLWDSLVEEVHPVEEFEGYSLEEAIEKARSGEIPIWKCEHRIRARDGSTHWVFESAVELRNAKGDLVGSIGSYQDITERKKAQEALVNSEKRFRALIENGLDQISLINPQGELLWESPSATRTLGYPENTFLHHNLFELMHPDDLAWTQDQWAELLQEPGGRRNAIFRLLHADGTWRWIEATVSNLQHEPAVNALVINYRDITERKQAEEELREAREIFQKMFDSSPMAIALSRLSDRTIVDVNVAMEKMLGYTRAELVGKPVTDFDYWANLQERQGALETLLRERTLRDYEFSFKTKSATIGQALNYTEMFEQRGDSFLLTTFVDITERKQAEEALEQSEQKFRTLFELAPVGISVIDAEHNIVDANYALQQITGLKREELMAGHSRRRTYLRPDGTVMRPEEVASARAVRQDMPIFNVETGIVTEDRGVVWTQVSAAPLQTLNSGVVVVTQDITDRKVAEGALHDSESRYRALFEDSPVAIWEQDFSEVKKNLDLLRQEGITDMRGYFSAHPERVSAFASMIRILDVNRAGVEMYGAASKEDLIHDTAQGLSRGEMEHIHEDLIAVAEGRTTRSWEGADETMTGRPIEISLTWSVAPGHQADYSRVIVTTVDITERKRAEIEIRHRTEDLLLINTLNESANRGEDIQSMAEVFTREARATFNCNAVAIYLLSADGNYIEMQSSTLPGELTERIEKLIGRSIPRIKIPLKAGGYFGQILANEQGTITRDPQAFQQWIEEFTNTTFLPDILRAPIRKLIPQIRRMLPIQSAITVPLISSGRTIGLLDISSTGDFSEEDLSRIHTISRQVTAVILRKQAEEQVRLQLQRLRALSKIDRAISSSLDMRVSLDVLLGEVLSQLAVDAASILLFSAPAQNLEFVAGKGFRTKAIRHSSVRLGDGLAGQVGLERKTLHVSNPARKGGPFERAELLKGEGFVEYMGVPLVAKGVLKGVLEIYHRSPLDLDPEWEQYLETLGGQAAIAIDNVQLFEGMQQSNFELVTAYDATIAGWSHAMDLRDKETEGHTQRVTELTVRLAEKMDFTSAELIHIRRGALLHDVGKLGVPDHILLKPGKLTEEEWVIMKQHPAYAFEMLMPIPYLRPAMDIPYCHHEKWDGSGYPRGLKDEQIPLTARLFAVVDVWDALRSDRPYRASWSAKKTREYILEESGRHFDPKVVEVFLNMIEDK